MNTKLKGCFLSFLLLFTITGFSQNNFRVTGVVRSGKDNTPMGGVNIQLKGSIIYAGSQPDGSYAIDVPDTSGTLIFTYVGYASSEVPIQGRRVINLTMEAAINTLSEVVVTGYSTQSRNTVSTSISRVGAQEFANAPAANPLNQLQGKVAGLSLQIPSGQPGANPQIFIRGGASTSPESDAPLFVVDGVVGAMRNISDINPDDIESMQVLKDAASTAIYGARAANGVIIIKTKSGRRGAPSIQFKYQTGVEQQARKYDFTSAEEYIYISRLNTMKFNASNPNLFLTGGTYGMSTGNPRNAKNTLEFLDTYISNYGAEYVADLIDNQGWQTMTDPVTGRKLLFKETNYQNVTFQDANRHEYDVSVSGGSDRSTYYLSLGHLNQEGIVTGTDYKNYSALMNATYKLSNSWELNTNLSYVMRNSKGIGNVQNVLSRSVTMPFTYRLHYEDGLPAPGEGVGSFRNRNHEVYYRDQYSDNRVIRTNLNLGATWTIMPGLSFRPSVYWFTTEGITNAFEAYNEVNQNRNASAAHSFIRQGQADALLEYQKQFGGKHNTNTVIGASYIDNYDYNITASGYGAPTDNVRTVNATSILTQRSSTTIAQDKVMSFFGQTNYHFDRRFLFSASLRYDGSSRFAEKNKWGLFPGLSAGWNLHNEAFWDNLSSIIPTFKVRSSWGQAGQNNLSIFDTQGQYSVGSIYQGQVGILNTVLANQNLVWETTTSFDVGADVGLLRNRLNVIFDYYDKRTTDRIFNQPLDATSGFSSITSNYGTIKTTGFEFEISSTPIRNKNFTWNLSATYSYNHSTVVELPENGEIKNRIGGNIVWDPRAKGYVKVGGFAEGERYGGRWAYNMIGVYATDEAAAGAPRDVEANNRVKRGGDAIWQDVDENGIIDARDMVFMGYIRPDKMGGMVNSFTWKGLSLRFVVDFALGHVIDNSFKARSMASARNNNMTLAEVMGTEIWNNPGDVARYPKYTVQSDADYNYRNYLRNSNGLASTSGYISANSLFHSKGDYLAFREVSFTYNLNASFLQKAAIKSVTLFAGIFNLGYITNYDGLMPEVYTGNDQGSYPRPRQFNFGATFNF